MKFRYFITLTFIWLLSTQMDCNDYSEELPLSENLKAYIVPENYVVGDRFVYANLDDTTELDTYTINYVYPYSKYFDDRYRGEGLNLYLGTMSQNIFIACYAYLNSPSIMVDVNMPYYDPGKNNLSNLDSAAQFHKTEWVGYSKPLLSYSTPWKVFNDVIESEHNYKGSLNPTGLNAQGIGFGRFKWAKEVGLIYFEGFFGKDYKSNPSLKRVVLKEILPQ